MVARGATDAIDFRAYIFIFPVFSLLPPPFYIYISIFFYFWGGSIESIASIAKHCVLNLNLTDGSKPICGRSIASRARCVAVGIPPKRAERVSAIVGVQ